MGYAGGTTKDPTYYNIGDHSESVQLDFDPLQVTYEELVEDFFSFHDATIPAFSNQYASVILVLDAGQERIARAVVQRVQESSKNKIETRIAPLDRFHPAEEYHQKYALQTNGSLMKEYRAMYPDFWNLVDSTAATRVNAYLYGAGSALQLSAEINSLGLSDAGEKTLLDASPLGSCLVN